MSNFRISVDAERNGQSVHDFISPLANESDFLTRLSEIFNGIASGLIKAKLRLNTKSDQATGTVTFATLADNDTVTVNGVVFTAKTSPSGAQQFAVGSSDEAGANNFTAKINASVLAKIGGTIAAHRRGTITLSSFVADNTVTVNNVVFTGKASPSGAKQFAIGTSDTITAANLRDAISAYGFGKIVSVSASSAVVTVNFFDTLTLAISANGSVAAKISVMTCLIPGQIGNLCTLAISNGSVSGANLTGGTEGTETLYSKNYTAI